MIYLYFLIWISLINKFYVYLKINKMMIWHIDAIKGFICDDLNECDTNPPCHSEARCQNQIGSYMWVYFIMNFVWSEAVGRNSWRRKWAELNQRNSIRSGWDKVLIDKVLIEWQCRLKIFDFLLIIHSFYLIRIDIDSDLSI